MKGLRFESIEAQNAYLAHWEEKWAALRIHGRAKRPDGARLLLADFWTDATHTQPPFAALLAAEFFVITGEGDVYSEEEASGWLEETGWRTVERKPLAGAVSLLVAETAA